MLMKPDTPCRACPLYGDGTGFVPAHGDGTNGVLIVLEAAGEDEAAEGIPTVGRAGYYLWSALAKAGLEREPFRVHNVLSCRPPGNKLIGMPYTQAAIACCAPLLDATIREHHDAAVARGQQPVILTLGRFAFERIMGADATREMLKEDYQAYVHRSMRYDSWVIAADHPSYIMRGNHHLVPMLQFAAQRAVEVAAAGFRYHDPTYILDPPAAVFQAWVAAYRRALDAGRHDTYLSFDIETPRKAKRGEDKLVREDDDDYIILRCSFSWQPGHAISIPWQAEYLPAVEELLGDSRNKLVGWNLNYDVPRVANQLTVRGERHDAMLAWHVLNSALAKGLGFVTPFYAKDARMWKHLAGTEPARYNAQDADMALRNYLGIRADLVRAGQMEVFERHIIALHRVTDAMSAAGVLRDDVMRADAEARLTVLLDDLEREMEVAVPRTARREKRLARQPKDMTGVEVTQVMQEVSCCPICGELRPKGSHFKLSGPKAKKVNLCGGVSSVMEATPVDVFTRVIEWKPSSVGLKGYQASLRHQAVQNRQKGTVTFDEDALKALMRKYPKDPLYPLLLRHRHFQRLRGTYLGVTDAAGIIRGGLRIGKDGRIHPEFTDNPSTLRMACQNPNMQNLPRVNGEPATVEEEMTNVVRNLIVAAEGYELLELDYAAIEAVLSAYFARWRDGIRLAKLGVHAYLASHVLKRPADLSWPDADLKAYFKEIKGATDAVTHRTYQGCKRAIHLSNYGGTPRKMVQAEPETFPNIKFAESLQSMYFSVAAPIRKWQLETQLEAHQNGYLRNCYSYVHRFTHVFRNVKENGQWVRKPGDQANEVLAFLPQSTAAGIIKEAMLRMHARDEIRPWMRLQVHDSLVFEVPKPWVDDVERIAREEMCRPIEELPLPASYNLGPFLTIDVDSKRGARWGEVK